MIPVNLFDGLVSSSYGRPLAFGPGLRAAHSNVRGFASHAIADVDFGRDSRRSNYNGAYSTTDIQSLTATFLELKTAKSPNS